MATKVKSHTMVQGHWEENNTPWYEQTMFYCDACGMLIAKKQFVVEDSGGSRRFCGSNCAQLDGRVPRPGNRKSTRS